MIIEKSWTSIRNRNSNPFLDGLYAFLEHCRPLLDLISKQIACPCDTCSNSITVSIDTLWSHISENGFDSTYTTWDKHGEPLPPPPPPLPQVVHNTPQPPLHEYNDMATFLYDIRVDNDPTLPTHTTDPQPTTGPQPTQTTAPQPNNEFEELLARSTETLYPGCEMNSLDFMSKISHVKLLYKIIDIGFDKILDVFQQAFPLSKGFNLPSSYYEIKKTYKKIGLGYDLIHACINDCFLFWGSKENELMQHCPTCKASRWKDSKIKGKKVANKVLRYFSLKSRLQHMYNSQHTAKLMTWHGTGKSKEKGKMHHPVDGEAWIFFDIIHPQFSKEPRSVRLWLAADGFNPFNNLSQTYNMWPIILTTYNIPPWICMKETSFMLTMLILGPKSSAKDIDVFLRPLIEELKTLWGGVWTKYVATGTYFNMKATLLWTINDFPARSSLSGWIGQGYFACPTCNKETPATRVRGKIAYVGYRRFLRVSHPMRNKKKEFQGEVERVHPPERLTNAR
ncbi:CACTA transposable element [Tanacetum coccineum]